MVKKITLKVWMAIMDMNARKIAEQYSIINNHKGSEQFVGRFIKGNATSKPLAEFLISKGCPPENFKNGKVAA